MSARLAAPISLGFLLSWPLLFAGSAQTLLECEDLPACSEWASDGDNANCSAYPGLMRVNCPVLCKCCADHEAFRNCSQAAVGTPHLVTSPAALSELFDGIADRARTAFGPGITVLHDDPMVLQIDGFLSPQDAAAVVELAEGTGFQRGDRYIDGAADLRTSSTTFCRGPCMWTVAAAALTERIANVLQISARHFEPIQFVKYEEGQHYALHSDFVEGDVATIAGPRLLTFFVFLSTGFQGGETAFPGLDLKVEPKIGRAILWRNTFPYVGGRSGKLRWLQDSKMEHEALPVGVVHSMPKYAANIWVHDGDVRLAERYGDRCKQVLASQGVEALEL